MKPLSVGATTESIYAMQGDKSLRIQTSREKPRIAILHYSAPPVVGGVEAVIFAHTLVFSNYGYPVGVLAGRGQAEALPSGTSFTLIPEMDSQHPRISEMSVQLDRGEKPAGFTILVNELTARLAQALVGFDVVILHNLFTKHFNLPLTAAVYALLDSGEQRRWIAWCHDFSWTSPHSRNKVHPGHPWELLRTYRPDVTYVTVSRRRQEELAGLLGCPPDTIQVIYNGIDPQSVLGISPEGWDLSERLGLLESDLILLMPVRVTEAKNIEYACQVAAALKSKGLQFKLVVTGPPDPHAAESMAYFSSLQSMRRDLGLEEEVRFVFESGPVPQEPYFIDLRVVGDLYRLSDLLFMPSHREGFGIPVLEAGLAGLPILAANIPAVEEIGGGNVTLLDLSEAPEVVAGRIQGLVEGSPERRMRRKIRKGYTWRAIFQRDIEPLLA